MTSIIQRDRRFEPGCSLTWPHRPTKGGAILEQAQKLAYWVSLASYDAICAAPLVGEKSHDPFYRFIDTTLNRQGKLFTQDNVLTYVEFLKNRFPNSKVEFISNGLAKNTTIEGVDPLSVIGGKERQPKDLEEEDDWVYLFEDAPRTMRHDKRIIAYPFVYPSVGLFTLPHVVLILVDQEESEIYYYDPQGLSSDDPCRLRIFQDDLDFNMHENLVQLAKVLFSQNPVVKIVENLSPHQVDPVNCGTLICRVLLRLFSGIPIEEALMFNQLVDSPFKFKKEAGHSYLQALNLMTGKEVFEITKAHFDKRYTSSI